MITEFYLILVTTLIFAVLVTIWLCFMLNTDMFLKFGLRMVRKFAGMNVHYISRKCGKGVWCYAEKGAESSNFDINNNKYPTLVFIHGFGGDKDTWPSIVRRIPSKYHCVIVDMPGHGETTFLEGVDEPSIESYVKALKEFLEVTNFDRSKIYLIGCSFGGAIAALFTHYYPENVQNLALLCPAIKTPILTETCKKLMNGQFDLLIPENGEQFITMIGLLCNKTQYYPQRIMQSFVNINFHPERQSLLKKILTNLVTNDLERFEDEMKYKISSIDHPTLIIWGKDDEMLHVSGARFLNENIRNSKLKIIDDCNHVLQLDQPKKTTKYLLDFLKKVSLGSQSIQI